MNEFYDSLWPPRKRASRKGGRDHGPLPDVMEFGGLGPCGWLTTTPILWCLKDLCRSSPCVGVLDGRHGIPLAPKPYMMVLANTVPEQSGRGAHWVLLVRHAGTGAAGRRYCLDPMRSLAAGGAPPGGGERFCPPGYDGEWQPKPMVDLLGVTERFFGGKAVQEDGRVP